MFCLQDSMIAEEAPEAKKIEEHGISDFEISLRVCQSLESEMNQLNTGILT